MLAPIRLTHGSLLIGLLFLLSTGNICAGDPTLTGWIDTSITGSNAPRPRALPRTSELRGTL